MMPVPQCMLDIGRSNIGTAARLIGGTLGALDYAAGECKAKGIPGLHSQAGGNRTWQ